MSNQPVLTVTSSVKGDPIEMLQSRIQGQVLTPADPQYDEARLAWNRTIDQRPAVIIIAASAADVAEAVQFARRQNMGVGVQSTGHGVTLPADNAVLILTYLLKELVINPEAQTAWIGAGLKWGEVLAKTQEYGLAPLLGSSTDVGVVGYTLGGGLGWLARKYGLATDSVLCFEVVTAEGQVVRASQEENADLFWGLRGGGGSFGVVTGMEIRLYPVREFYGGNLYYSADNAKEVMQRYREWIRTAPDELTTSIVLMNYPPFPQVPEVLRGKSFVQVRGSYIGPVEEGEALLSYWRDWKAPVIDDFKKRPFSQVDKVSNDPVDPTPARLTGAWLRELSDEAIDSLIYYALPHNGPPPLIFIEVRHAGGAVSRVQPGTSAFSNRDAELVMVALGIAPTPAAEAHIQAHTDQLRKELEPVLTGGVYMNFVEGSEARHRTKDGYKPEAFRLLQSLKGKVDPANTFRFSYDIAPEK